MYSPLWLQYQITRNSLQTNYIVSHFQRNVTRSCQYCQNSDELISHIFWSCIKITDFLQQVISYLESIILSHALFLKVFKSWVYPSKKKVWCASKIFLKIENMGPKECKNVKILKKNPWHQLSSWGSLSWSQSIKINCNFGVLLIKLTNFRCLLCLNGGSNRPEH